MKNLTLALSLLLTSAQALELTVYPSFAEFREPVTVSSTVFTYGLPLEKRSLMALDSLRLEGIQTLAQTLEFPALPPVPVLVVKDPLESFVGKTVFVRENGQLLALRLIRTGPDALVVREEKSGLFRTDLKAQALLYPSLPPAPVPVAPVKLPYPANFAQMSFEVEKPGKATLSYLSRALSWSPHYALEVGASGKGVLESWADLYNAGASRIEADRVQLVAGKVSIMGFSENPQTPVDYRLNALEDSGRAVGASSAVQSQGENAGNFSYLLKGKLSLERGAKRSVPFIDARISVVRLAKPVKFSQYDSSTGQNVQSWQVRRSYRISSDTFLPTGPMVVREAGQLLGQTLLRDVAPQDKADLELGFDPGVLFEKSMDKSPNQTVVEIDPNGYKRNLTLYTTLIILKATNTKQYPAALEYAENLRNDLSESGDVQSVSGPGQLNLKTLDYLLSAEIPARSSQTFTVKVTTKSR